MILRFFLVTSLQFLLDYLDVSEKNTNYFWTFWGFEAHLEDWLLKKTLKSWVFRLWILPWNDRNYENIHFPHGFLESFKLNITMDTRFVKYDNLISPFVLNRFLGFVARLFFTVDLLMVNHHLNSHHLGVFLFGSCFYFFETTLSLNQTSKIPLPHHPIWRSESRRTGEHRECRNSF